MDVTKLADADELFQAGDLQGAINAQVAKVKNRPTDLPARKFLGELFCFSGELERADKQFELIGNQEPKAAANIALIRQLVRAETWRRDCFSAGRLPTFLKEPSPLLAHQLKIITCLRDGAVEEAYELAQLENESLAALKVVCNGIPYIGMRDLDDLTPCFFEILTQTGKYYWIGMDEIEQLEFFAPETAIDLLWRRASIDTVGGPSGDVYFPATYYCDQGEVDTLAQLGRKTDWLAQINGIIRGIGQKMFLVGEKTYSLMEIDSIAFEQNGAA